MKGERSRPRHERGLPLSSLPAAPTASSRSPAPATDPKDIGAEVIATVRPTEARPAESRAGG